MAWLFSVLARSFEWALPHGDNMAVRSSRVMSYFANNSNGRSCLFSNNSNQNIRIEFHWLWLVCLGSHTQTWSWVDASLTQATGTENEENQTSVRKRGHEYGCLLYYFQQYVVSRKVLFVFCLISSGWVPFWPLLSGPVDIFSSILHIWVCTLVCLRDHGLQPGIFRTVKSLSGECFHL